MSNQFNFRKGFPAIITAALGLLSAPPASADPVFADVTTSNTVSDYFPVSALSTVDGMDLSSGTPGVLDAVDRPTQIAGSTNAWVTADHGDLNPTYQDYFAGASAGPVPALTFGFNAPKNLESILIWNYPADGGGLRGCAKTIDIAVNKGSGFETIRTAVGLTKGNALATVADVVDIGTQIGVTAVRITITDNYFDGVAAGGDRVGLGKVAFTPVGSNLPIEFKIIGWSINKETGEISVTWTSVPTKFYSVYYATDPSDFSKTVVSGVSGEVGTTTFTFSSPMVNAPRLFFRVGEQP